MSAAHAADEMHGLTGCLDHIAIDRSQDLTAASAASDAAQACNAQIAQAHADLADVGTPTQTLGGGPTAERGVAWSTLGQASSSGDAGDTHDASSDPDPADAAAIASGPPTSPDPDAATIGPGTQVAPDADLFLQAGVAGTVVTVAIPTPLPASPANIITTAIPQAIGQAAQALGGVMSWSTFGIGCALIPSNTRAAQMQSRRERLVSVSARRPPPGPPSGDGR